MNKIDPKDVFFFYDVNECVAKTGTNLARGLSKGEAKDRLKVYGKNELAKEDPATLWERILE